MSTFIWVFQNQPIASEILTATKEKKHEGHQQGGADSDLYLITDLLYQVHEKILEALTTVKSVSKTDATTLLGVFGSLENILQANIEDLSSCPGFVPHKAFKLHKVLQENFKRL